MMLAELIPGQAGVVERVEGELRIKLRLAEMGLVQGARVVVERVAPLGDPRSYTVRGYQISLRQGEARLVEVAVAD